MAGSLHALLIGVDFYEPSVRADGAHYPSLSGCVPDVSLVRDFLRSRLAVPESNVIFLTATNREPHPPPEPPESRPTYENILGAFARLADRARSGDQVYIHFSGHGGRVRTMFPDLKGINTTDETLVPTDIGDESARHLRDVELAHLLDGLADRGLHVTLVLDCCHSGGATRSETTAVIRGIDAIDDTPRSEESLAGTPADLKRTLAARLARRTRSLDQGGGWLWDRSRTITLTGCRASEFSHEDTFGDRRHGALTYWWVEGLNRLTPEQTYESLYRRIQGKVHLAFPQQTPQLYGDASRIVFGLERRLADPGITVAGVTDDLVRLDTGVAQGVHAGARLTVRVDGAPAAVVEVVTAGALRSDARIVERLSATPIDSGAQAIVTEAGERRRVVVEDPALLAALERTWRSEGVVRAAFAPDGPAEVRVARLDDGHVAIQDAAGRPLPGVAPMPAAALPGRLRHVLEVLHVRSLANDDANTTLANALQVSLLGVQSRYEPGGPIDPTPFPGAEYVMRDGEWTFLSIRNGSRWPLNVTVFNITPAWEIAQRLPDPAEARTIHVDTGEALPPIPYRAVLPPGRSEAIEGVKVFASVADTDWRWLQRPEIGGAAAEPVALRSAPAEHWGAVDIAVRVIATDRE